jgi:hemerythrin-like domain-containing protein
MANVLDKLRRDHANVGRVLRLLGPEFDRIEAGEPADYDLLHDAMRYVTGYSDLHHHPAEDVLYEALVKASPEAAKEVAAIVSEHEKLIERGRSFLDTVEAVVEEAMVRREEFLRIGRDYVDTLGRHMGIEESRLFPLADKTLSQEDLAAVTERLNRLPDPLFGPALDEEFRHLWNRIESHSNA